MIVLDAVNPSDRVAGLREVDTTADVGTDDFDQVQNLLERLGVSDCELRRVSDTADANAAGHRWMVLDGGVHYEASFVHAAESRDEIAVYSAIALATCGHVGEPTLLQLRLTAYELCLNVLEHGRPRRANGKIRLGFRVGADRIEGWVEDECEPFNPFGQSREAFGKRVAMRARRGYGIMIVQRLMDEVRHEITGEGNRITFVKRIEQ